MFIGDNFNEDFTADVAVGIFRKQYPLLFLFGNLSVYTKVICFQEKSTGSLRFLRNIETKRVNSCLTNCSQKRKKKKKHFQVFQVFRKNPRKWNYGWSSVLKTCTVLIVGIFGRIFWFDEVFLMALTST